MTRPRPTLLQTMIRSEPVRVAQLAAGVLLILMVPLGASVPLPLPIGLVMFGTGLALILRNSGWARRKYVRWQHRYPRAGRITDIGLRRKRRKPPLTVPVPIEAPTVAEPVFEAPREQLG